MCNFNCLKLKNVNVPVLGGKVSLNIFIGNKIVIVVVIAVVLVSVYFFPLVMTLRTRSPIGQRLSADQRGTGREFEMRQDASS